MIGRRLKSVFFAIALVAAAMFAHDSMAQKAWYYTIGEQRSNQQANFCLKRQTVFAIARIFEQEGPRPGYAALDRKSGCNIRVESFTPQKIITRVMIETGDGGRYTVSFVEVKTSRGVTEYLVTTRDVFEQN